MTTDRSAFREQRRAQDQARRDHWLKSLTDRFKLESLVSLFRPQLRAPDKAKRIGTRVRQPKNYRQHHPAGTKLIKRFIRDATGEQTEYRKMYAALTGRKGDSV